MVEVNCETDFVARTDDFKQLAKDIAMHIAAANPVYLSREDVPQDVLEREKEIYKAQVANKPPQVVEKIIEGKLEKFLYRLLSSRPDIHKGYRPEDENKRPCHGKDRKIRREYHDKKVCKISAWRTALG